VINERKSPLLTNLDSWCESRVKKDLHLKISSSTVNIQIPFVPLTVQRIEAEIQYRNMTLSKFDGLELPAAADFHVHLRDGAMSKLVIPAIVSYS